MLQVDCLIHEYIFSEPAYEMPVAGWHRVTNQVIHEFN